MYTIEIDFEVFKALTARRTAEDVSENDVLRQMLNLNPKAPNLRGSSAGWTYKGVTFPEGTEFKAAYKGLAHYGVIHEGQFLLLPDREPMNSPSEAAHRITGTSVNGWAFWECKFPGLGPWRQLSSLRR